MVKVKMVANSVEIARRYDGIRPFQSASIEASATLMVNAYRESIDWEDGDDEATAIVELKRVVDGEYGEFLEWASFSCVNNQEVLESQILTALLEGEPTILLLYTAKNRQGQGLATALIRHAAAILNAKDFSNIYLYVTRGNPAEDIYRHIGFKEL